MPDEKKPVKPVRVMPSQNMLKWIEEEQKAGRIPDPFNVQLSVSLAIVDKLDDILMAIRYTNKLLSEAKK